MDGRLVQAVSLLVWRQQLRVVERKRKDGTGAAASRAADEGGKGLRFLEVGGRILTSSVTFTSTKKCCVKKSENFFFLVILSIANLCKDLLYSFSKDWKVICSR